jgi:hypothetical protein
MEIDLDPVARSLTQCGLKMSTINVTVQSGGSSNQTRSLLEGISSEE